MSPSLQPPGPAGLNTAQAGWLLPHGTGISIHVCTGGMRIWLMLWSSVTALHCSNGSWSKTRSWWRKKGRGKHTVWEPEGCPEPRFAQRGQLENPSWWARAEPAGCIPPRVPRLCGCRQEAAGAAQARLARWSGALDPGSAPSLALPGSIPGHAPGEQPPAGMLPQHPVPHPHRCPRSTWDRVCEHRDNEALAGNAFALTFYRHPRATARTSWMLN